MERVPEDPRARVVRSPHCPNRTKACQHCAWGLVTSEGKGEGELSTALQLVSANEGYKSDCGWIELFWDQHGRLGAVREGRFFPGIPENEAFVFFVRQKPLLGVRLGVRSES